MKLAKNRDHNQFEFPERISSCQNWPHILCNSFELVCLIQGVVGTINDSTKSVEKFTNFWNTTIYILQLPN